MAYDSFSTRIMLQAIEQMQPKAKLLGQMFFGKTTVLDGEYADVDLIDIKAKVATYADENDESTLVEKPTRTMSSVKIPNIALKSRLTPSDLLKRPIGQTQYDGLASEAEEINKQIAYLTDMVYRAVELQAAQALQLGVTTIAGNGVSNTITFGRDASLTYTIGTTKWDAAGGNPLSDLETLCKLILAKSGTLPNNVVMGSDALAAFMGNATVQAQFNMFNANYGQIAPTQINAEGAAYLGKVMIPGFHLAVYSYPLGYIDSNNALQPYIAAKKVIVGCSTAQNQQVYGAIRDVDGLKAAQFFPKIWKNNDPSCYYIGLKSSPLCMLSQPNATGCIQVIS